MKYFFTLLFSLGVAGTSTAAIANNIENYPEKAIRIVVPYAPGGFNDTMARVFAQKLQGVWDSPVIVENRGGAGTIVGTEYVARAEADGYTLLVNGFPYILNQFLYEELPYDTNADFIPVIGGAQARNFLVVKADSPIQSLTDFIEKAKAEPGALSYASAGNGSSNHVTMEYFKELAGIDLEQIPYKGSAPMVTDMLGGRIDIMFDGLPHVHQYVKGGQMRALGITSPERSQLAPEVPTIAEQGFPDFDVAVPFGIFAPAGTPKEIIEKLNKELDTIIQMDDVQEILLNQGVEPLGGTPEDFATLLNEHAKKWAEVVDAAEITAQ